MLRAAIATKKVEVIAVNDPFLSTDYMVSDHLSLLYLDLELKPSSKVTVAIIIINCCDNRPICSNMIPLMEDLMV